MTRVKKRPACLKRHAGQLTAGFPIWLWTRDVYFISTFVTAIVVFASVSPILELDSSFTTPPGIWSLVHVVTVILMPLLSPVNSCTLHEYSLPATVTFSVPLSFVSPLAPCRAWPA